MLVAIETATDTGSVAVGTAAGLAGEVSIGGRGRHAETLLPALDFLLRAARVSRGDLEAIVVGGGPGSFTGVRIAAATARGLAAGLGIPLYAYSSLAAAAAEVPGETPVCALFDARRGEVYAACYRRDAGVDRLHTLMAPTALRAADLDARVGPLAPRYVGEGAVRYAAVLGIAPPPPVPPRASALLRLAIQDIAEGGSGRVHHPAGWEPSYVRSPGAERGVAG